MKKNADKTMFVLLLLSLLFFSSVIPVGAIVPKGGITQEEAENLVEKAVYLYWHFVDWGTIPDECTDYTNPFPEEYDTEEEVSALARSIYPEEIADDMWMYGERTYRRYVENNRWVTDSSCIVEEAKKSFITDSNGFLMSVDADGWPGPNRPNRLHLADETLSAQRKWLEISENSAETASGSVLVDIDAGGPFSSEVLDVVFRKTPNGWRISGGNFMTYLSPDAMLTERTEYLPEIFYTAFSYPSSYWRSVNPTTYSEYKHFYDKNHVVGYTSIHLREAYSVLGWDDDTLSLIIYPDCKTSDSPQGYLAIVKVVDAASGQFEFVGGNFKAWVDGENVSPYTGDSTPQTILLCSAAMLLSAMGAHAVLKMRKDCRKQVKRCRKSTPTF